MDRLLRLIKLQSPRLKMRLAYLLIPLFAVIIFMTAYPLSLIFINSFKVGAPGQPATWGLDAWQSAFADPTIPMALANTFLLAGIRVVIALTLAIFFAWVVTRTDTPCKGFIEFTLWLGFFLPHLPITLGWILLLDPDVGLLNKFLMNLFNLSAPPFNIYSYGGIIWAHLAFGTSIRFLLITPAFRTMDAALEEAAHTSGCNHLVTLMRITIPILTPAIVAAVILGFIKSIQSLEVELVLGFPVGIFVYSTKIWEYLNWEPARYGAATALSSLFVVVIFAMVFVQRMMVGRRQFTTITGRGYTVQRTSLGPWRWVTFSCCMLFIIVMIFLPLLFVILGTFMKIFGVFEIQNVWTLGHWANAFDDPTFTRSLRNTLSLGAGAGLVGVFLYAVISYVLVRLRFTGRGFLDFLIWLPWALPGVLTGLALLYVFVGSGGILAALYGTIYLLIIAIVVSELPLGTQILKANILQVHRELEEAAWASGASWVYTFRRIVLPILTPAMIAVGLVVFISAVRDIPTVVFLSTFRSRTLSLLMLDYIAGGSFEKATVIGVLVIFIIVVAAVIARVVGLRMNPNERG